MNLTFRPLTRADFDQLGTWLSRPHVERWWKHEWTPEALEADFGGATDGVEPTEHFVVQLDGRDIGLIQRYFIGAYPEWLHALRVVGAPPTAIGIDYFIGELDLVNRGIGTAMIGAFLERTWREYPEATEVFVDVDPENRASWRAIERNGLTFEWEGELESDDPSDQGTAWVFRLHRPSATMATPTPMTVPTA